jgi:hypothetical protein
MIPCTIQLPRQVVNELHSVSKLSSKKRWEYAGSVGIKYDKGTFTFDHATRYTSRERSKISFDVINKAWPSVLTYHTHPAVIHNDHVLTENIFTTLPSSADFESFIKGFPLMQVNIICDAHGYYLIDLIDSVKEYKLPVPLMVNHVMCLFRCQPYIQDCRFSEDGYEYFNTSLEQWKSAINDDLCGILLSMFGIRIQYYGYDDDPAMITFDMNRVEE